LTDPSVQSETDLASALPVDQVVVAEGSGSGLTGAGDCGRVITPVTALKARGFTVYYDQIGIPCGFKSKPPPEDDGKRIGPSEK